MAVGGDRPGRDRDASAAALAVLLGGALAKARAALVSAVRDAATVAADSVSGFARVDPAVVQAPAIWQPAVTAAERFAADAYWDAVDAELGDIADGLSVEELDETFGDGETEAVAAAVAAVTAWRDNAAAWAAGRVEAAIAAGTSIDDLVDGLADEAAGTGPLADTASVGLAGVAASAVWIVAALGVARSGLAAQPTGGVEGDDSGTSGSAGQVAGKRWSSQLDEKVRSSHAALEGVVVPVDADFDVGGFPAAYPRDDRLPPAESQNCRCWVQAAMFDGAPIDETALPANIPADVAAALQEGDMFASRRRTWRAWFEVDQLHTHGRCSRCGGWLQPDKWCPACGGGYDGPGDSRDRSGPHREPEPDGGEVVEVEAAARRWRPWFARGVARFEWDESLHPRDDDGRFGPGGGGSGEAASPARPGLSEEQAERARAMFERAPAPAVREDDGSGRAAADAALDVHAVRAGALGLRGDTRLGREVGAIIGDHPDGPAAAREAFLRDPARVSAAGAAVRAEMAVRAGASDEWARQHEELTVARLQADAAGRLPGFLPFEGSKVDLGGGQSTAFLVAQKDVAVTLDRVGRWEQMTAGLEGTARWDALHEEEIRVLERLDVTSGAEEKGLRQELNQLADYRSGNGQAAVDAMRAVGDVGGRATEKGVEVDGRVYGWRNLGDAQTALGERADGMARDLAATAPEGPYRAALELDGHRADYTAAVRETARIGRELDAAVDGLGSLERGSAAEAAAYERIADLQARSDTARAAVDRASAGVKEARQRVDELAAGHADRLLEVLSDIRPMGGRVDHTGESRDAATVGRYLPGAWIDASNARGQVRFDSVPAGENAAGFYSDRDGRVVVGDGYTGRARDATIIHEFTHRAQYSSLALQQADAAYFWSRIPAREATAGLVDLLGYKVAGVPVEGYRDGWADPYMGRRYANSTLRPFQQPSTARAYPTSELLTKSVEMAYLGPTASGGYDAAAAAWAMGVLATV